MNDLRLRILRITTLLLTALLGYEGFYHGLQGHLVGRIFPPNAIPATEDVMVGLPNGLVIQYPFWAQCWIAQGIDPAIFAPLFAGLGGLGLFTAILMWRQKWFVVWVLLVPFHLMAILHWGIGSVIAIVGLIGLFLPGWRAFWFKNHVGIQETPTT